MGRHAIRAGLMCSTALMITPLQAQEELGTIYLGQSKREVQTGTAVPVTEVDLEEIRDRQASTVAELIDTVPGVTLVNGSTPQGSGINIRGFGANSFYGTDQKVEVQIDGASVGAEELYRIGTQLYTDPELYREVEVIRGTVGSFEYGSGIVGGVVRLETVDASDFTGGEPGFAWRQTLQYGTNGDSFVSSTILAWQPTETLEFLGNYTCREQDDQEDGAGEIIGNSAYELPSYLLKGRLSFGHGDAHSVEASYTRTTSADRDVPYDTFGTTGGLFGNVDRDIDSRTIALTYGYAPAGNDLVDVDVTLSYADQEIVQDYIEGSSPFAPPGGSPVVNADNRYETTKLTARNTALFTTGGVGHDLRFGTEFTRRERLDASAAPGGTGRRAALFAVDDVTYGNVTLTPALRYERSVIEGMVDRDGDGADELPVSYETDALVGGLSARYAFANGFSVFGSGAYTEVLPILDDLETPFDRDPANDAYVTTSEKSRTWEIGAAYDRVGLLGMNDVLALKANLYQTALWDVTSYSGVAEVELHGLELEASYATEAGWYTDINANFVEGTAYDAEGVDEAWANTPQDTIRLTVGKTFGETLDLSWEALGAFGEDADEGAAEADGYTLYALRATYAPQAGALAGTEIRLGLENATDVHVTPALSTRPVPGRTFKVTLARTF